MDNASLELMYELELIPVARSMVGLEIEDARKINPNWCLRPESTNAYAILQRTSDEDLMVKLQPLAQADKYMMLAVQHIGESIPTSEIGEKMQQEWVKRTEGFYVSKLLDPQSTIKQKLSFASAIKALYHEQSPEVYVIDMANPSPPMDFLMTYQGVNYRPRGDISVVTAKKKSGKSSFLKIEIATMISPSGQINGMSRTFKPGTEEIRPPYRVLWIDTEQSFASSDKAYWQVLQLAGLPTNHNDPHLKMINLRMMSSQARLAKVEEEVELSEWDVVVLDGVKDVVADINDRIETDNFIARLLRMIQDAKVAFITVIHENPSKDSDKMRGHLGTELGNKAFEIQEVRPNPDTGVYTVSNTDRREKPIPAYGFRFDDNDNLVQCDPDAKGVTGPGPQAPTREEKQWNQFTKAFESNLDLSMTQEEIVFKLLPLGMSESTIKRRVKTYNAMKWLVAYDTDGVTRYGLSTEKKIAIRARLNGEEENPIIGPNDPIWSAGNEDPPF